MGEGAFEFDDERLRRIHADLLLIGPGPAAFFRDACRLMGSAGGLESSSHIVGHLLRELHSSVLDVLSSLAQYPPIEPSRTDSANAVDSPDGDENADKLKHQQKVQRAMAALGIGPEEALAQAWLGLPKDINLHGLAHRSSLRSPRPTDAAFLDKWEAFVRILADVLDRLRAHYAKAVDLVDQLPSKVKPTKQDAIRLRDKTPNNPALLARFFGRCSNPNWIPPLTAAGFFSEPPEIAGWAFWPQSEYLARVASFAPAEVAAAVESIPPTRSEAVMEDLARAAVAMPTQEAKRVAVKVKACLQKTSTLQDARDIVQLIAHLGKIGETEAAIDLAREVLDVVPLGSVEQQKAASGDKPGEEPPTRLEAWAYPERFNAILEALAPRAGLALVEATAGTLNHWVSRQYSRKGNTTVDLSHSWRPAIEEHDQNWPFGSGNLLVSAARLAAERAIEVGQQAPGDVVAVFRKYRWEVFARLALHALRFARVEDPALLGGSLADRATFECLGVRHEYALLLGYGFTFLEAGAQGTILSWIQDGPDLSEYARFVREQRGREPEPEELSRYQEKWQVERLAWIGDGLSNAWRRRRAELSARVGEPEHPTFPSWHRSYWGPTSPVSASQLAAMGPAAVADYLRSWVPATDWRSPTREGLSRELAATVKDNARSFSEAARRWVGLDATYVSSLFGGLRDAVKDANSIAWQPVLDLAAWAVNQQRAIPGREPSQFDEDPHWGWCWQRLGELLDAGFRQGPSELPFELREAIWRILMSLTDDPDPSAEDDEGKTGGFATAAINSTRGVALGAVCGYCHWVRQALEASGEAPSRSGRWLHSMAEAQSVLETHLDPGCDLSLAIRAVYGERFPFLHWLDAEWAASILDRVFPEDDSGRRWFRAAWDSYITFCQPYTAVLGLMVPKYLLAIARIGESEGGDHVGHPDHRLFQHIFAYYMNGAIDIDSSDGLVEQFFATASPPLRRAALGYAGWCLARAPSEFTDDERRRLKALWEWTAQTRTQDEAAAFGSWFGSGVFEDYWALPNLEGALRASGAVETEGLVLTRLAALAAEYPAQCLRCLSLMATGSEPSHVYGWRQEIGAIVAAARASGDLGLSAEATEFVNRLMSRGLLDLRDLLGSERE